MAHILVTGATLTAWVLAPAMACAQAASPLVEAGIDLVGLLATGSSGPGRGPRLVVHFDERDALQLQVTLQPLTADGPVERTETDRYLATFKRVVHQRGSTRVFTTLGGAIERCRIVVPAITFGNPPITIPESSLTETVPAFTLGSGVEFRLGTHVAVVLDAALVWSDVIGGQLAAGLLVPLRAYPARSEPLASSVPWSPVSEGTRVWVTTEDGQEVDGAIVAMSATRLDLRTAAGRVTFAPERVRAIDTTDPIRNGVVLGAKIGGFGAILPSVLISYLVCAFEEECSAGDLVGVNALFIGLGTGIGATVGALADSLRERRAPVYRRSSGSAFSVVPIAPARGRGFGVAVTIGGR
jgi:hypothetical protein